MVTRQTKFLVLGQNLWLSYTAESKERESYVCILTRQRLFSHDFFIYFKRNRKIFIQFALDLMILVKMNLTGMYDSMNLSVVQFCYAFAQRTRKAYFQHCCLYSWTLRNIEQISRWQKPLTLALSLLLFFVLAIKVIKCHKERNETYAVLCLWPTSSA